jgi:excisionase family DNA binding protein
MDLLTAKETCARLRIGHSSLYRLLWAEVLTPVRFGRAVRFRADDVERIAREGVPSIPRAPTEARTRSAEGGR